MVFIPILWPSDAKIRLIWKDPDAGKDLRAGGEGDNRGWDGWVASPTQRTWVWVNSKSWWWTGRPGVLQFMGSQRVGHDWWTELTDWLMVFISDFKNTVSYIVLHGPELTHSASQCHDKVLFTHHRATVFTKVFRLEEAFLGQYKTKLLNSLI